VIASTCGCLCGDVRFVRDVRPYPRRYLSRLVCRKHHCARCVRLFCDLSGSTGDDRRRGLANSPSALLSALRLVVFSRICYETEVPLWCRSMSPFISRRPTNSGIDPASRGYRLARIPATHTIATAGDSL